jgi:deoxycytidine triphosphate deaminase
VSGPLTARQIRDYISSDGLLDHYDLEGCLAPVSYEMRVGNYYDNGRRSTVELQEGVQIGLAPRGFVLVGTVETVRFPLNLMGMMYLRSSHARRGFSEWFQGLVDPGYNGTLTVALHNLTDSLLAITGWERICHLVFYPLAEFTTTYRGIYQGSLGASPDRYGGGTLAIGAQSQAAFGLVSPLVSSVTEVSRVDQQHDPSA